jgi:hypothetical protein
VFLCFSFSNFIHSFSVFWVDARLIREEVIMQFLSSLCNNMDGVKWIRDGIHINRCLYYFESYVGFPISHPILPWCFASEHQLGPVDMMMNSIKYLLLPFLLPIYWFGPCYHFFSKIINVQNTLEFLQDDSTTSQCFHELGTW